MTFAEELSKVTGGIAEDCFQEPPKGGPVGFYFNGGEDDWFFTPNTLRMMAEVVDKFFGSKAGAVTALGASAPPVSQEVIASLQECYRCLERYCGPGTRGHEARKKAKEILNGLGLEL